MALVLPLASCENTPASAPEDIDGERITVLVDGPGDPVTEWSGTGDDFPDHPYIPEDVEISVAHPEFPGAEAFSSVLHDRIDREVMDFRGASRDPVELDITWEVVAADEGVLGVRLVRTEQDLHGTRQAYATYWYDAATGHTGFSTELLADDAALAELNGLVGEALGDHPDVDHQGLLPVMRTYDSIGFNAVGDLVVEFDDGHLSPVVEGHPPDASPGRIAEPPGRFSAVGMAATVRGLCEEIRELYLSDEGDADWKYQFAREAGAILLHDGDTFAVMAYLLISGIVVLIGILISDLLYGVLDPRIRYE
jgi:hypothetical protein